MSLAGFHPTVRAWFEHRLGKPTPPQEAAWPRIRAGRNVLVAAPTGSGKTLTAFLSALDELLRQGDALPPLTTVLYISPLKALSNDIAKNLDRPLAELREIDPSLPEIRVAVRTGDTAQKDRQAMVRKPPHILVTTPESFYLLLTSDSGRRMMRTVRTVIVDEIHALARDKRGSHLDRSRSRRDRCRSPAAARPRDRDPALTAAGGVLDGAMGRGLPADRGSDRSASHDVDLREPATRRSSRSVELAFRWGGVALFKWGLLH